MLRRLERDKIERILIVWKTQQRRIERELTLLRSTLKSGDSIVYDGSVENARMLSALGRRLRGHGYRLRCWGDPHRNEFRAWIEEALHG